MNLPLTGKINSKGHLEIGGCDAVALTEEFGTPLYVIDENDVRERCRAYRTCFKDRYPDSKIIFASKALSTTGLLRVIKDEGLGVDAASGGELFTALKAGFAPSDIYFHGNNKSHQEIEEGLTANVATFVVDNFAEIERLGQIAGRMNKKARALIRVNPGVEAHTHASIKTGQTDSKFGIQKNMVVDAVKRIVATGSIKFAGLHAHIGSQIFDSKGFLTEIDVLTNLMKEVKDKAGINIAELNIGGGIGISYVEKDDPIELSDFAEAITKRLRENISKFKLDAPKLLLEPGRSIIGRAGVTLYKVGTVKEIPGVRKYVIVDGGMSDNIRPMLYGAKYEFVPAILSPAKKEKYTIAGKFCESGDVLGKDVMLPEVKKGDIIASLVTGAYNYSMASNYNRQPRPAMVLVKGGNATLIIRRENYQDVSACDIV